MSWKSVAKDFEKMVLERDEVIKYLLDRLDLGGQYVFSGCLDFQYWRLDLYGPTNTATFNRLLKDIRVSRQMVDAKEARKRLGEC